MCINKKSIYENAYKMPFTLDFNKLLIYCNVFAYLFFYWHDM